MGERPLTAQQLSDALGCFWNAAIGEARNQQDGMAFAAIMAEGMAAVQHRLSEIAGEQERAALASQAAEIARLREENARLDHAASSMSAGLFRVTADNERATAEVGRLREALGNALTWHEDQDDGLSKQPPSHGPNGNQWARLQHREQMQEIRAVLDGEKP